MPRSKRVRRSAVARWAVVVAVYAAALLIAEVVFYGAFRLGVISSFSIWRAPLQVLPIWLVLGWLGARRAKGSLIACSVRARPRRGQQPRPWRRGQGKLAPGVFSFAFGTGSTVVVPPGPDQTIRVESIDMVQPAAAAGVLWVLKPVVLLLRGPDGDYDLKISATDLDRVRKALVPLAEPSSS